MELEVRPLEVRTDSTYVANGVEKLLQGSALAKVVRNEDLWQRLATLLEARPAGSVKVTKVKGHATEDDVRTGVVTGQDKFGNDSADALAVAGACCNSTPDRQSVLQHRAVVFTVKAQKMMLAIALARAACQEGCESSSSSTTEEESSTDSSGSSGGSDTSPSAS